MLFAVLLALTLDPGAADPADTPTVITTAAAAAEATDPAQGAGLVLPKVLPKEEPAPALRFVWRDHPSVRAGRNLDPVLEAPPETVRGQQRPGFAIAKETGDDQPREGARRVALAQIRPLTGVQQLQRLDHHLDVANPARAQLDVEPGLAQRPARVGRIAKQRPKTAHVVDQAGVDAAWKDERLEN